MKKNYFLLLFALLLSTSIFAQAPLIDVTVVDPPPGCNPGDCVNLTATYPTLGQTTNYRIDPIPYAPTFPFTGGTVLNASADDIWSPVFNLPFSFAFYGVSYNRVIIGSNGVISFNTANAGQFCPWAFNVPIPNPAFPIRNAIYGVYQDTDIRTPPVTNPVIQNVNYYVLDTGVNAAPNRVFVANWNELPLYSGACSAQGKQTSQIAIHEGTNIIDILVHNRQCCNSWNNGNGIIGTQNAAGTSATVAPGRNTSCWSTTDEAFQLVPIGPANVPSKLVWTKNGIQVGTDNQNPINVCPTGPETYTATVTYTNPNLTTFSVSTNVTIDVAPPLPVSSPANITLCELPAASYTAPTINQNSFILHNVSNPGGYTIDYYDDPIDAANGAGNMINAFSNNDLNNYIFTTAPKTIYVRISDQNGCANVRSFDLNVGAPTGTISYPLGHYCSTLPQQQVTATNLTGGGRYTATPAGLNIDPLTGAINPGSAPGHYDVTYTINPTVTCTSPFYAYASLDIDICTCTVIATQPLNSQVCANNIMPTMSFTVAGGAASASITAGSLPSWMSASFAGGTYYLSGIPNTPGMVNFTVSVDSGTEVCSVPVSIDVKAQAYAGVGYTKVICENEPLLNLFSFLTAAQPGGIWTRTGGTGGNFNAATGEFTPAVGATDSVFLYTVAGTLPCPDSTSTVNFTIVPQAEAGSNVTKNVCENDTTPIDLFTVLNGEQPGGTWARTSGSGGALNPTTGIFTPVVGSTDSTFEYTVLGTLPCPNDVSIVTIDFSPQPNAGTDDPAPTTFCDSYTTPINLADYITGEQAGGVWTRTSGLGGNFDATLGQFTLAAGATNSIFDYTITSTPPCTNSSSTVRINVIAQPNAGSGPVTPLIICDNDTAIPVNLFSHLTGAQVGGTWTRTGGTGGNFVAATGEFTPAIGATNSSFRYTILGTLPCANAVSDVNININAVPNAGTPVLPAPIVCETSLLTINLSDLLAGEQGGGVWTRVTGLGGNFDAVNGRFTPAIGATDSTFEYTIIGAGSCPNATSTVGITIIAQPDAGVTNPTPTTICDNNTAIINLADYITGEQAGGVWTRISGTGGIFIAGAGTFEPAVGATDSSFRYTITGTSPCVNSSSDVNILIKSQVNAGGNNSIRICDSNTTPINLFNLITGTPQAGGVWTRTSGTGGAFNAGTGMFTPAAGAINSDFDYTVSGIAPCANATSRITVEIYSQPDAGLTNPSPTTICDNSAAINLADYITGEQPGGVWTRTGGTGGNFIAGAGTFEPAVGTTDSSFRYTIGAILPCVDSTSDVNIVIKPRANAGGNNQITVCDNNLTPIGLFALITGTPQPGGTWTRTGGIGGNFNAGTGQFTPAPGATESTFDYIVTGSPPCANAISTVTVKINPQPDAGIGSTITICDTEPVITLSTLLTGAQPGGVWTRTSGTGGNFNSATGQFTPAAGALDSSFDYTITGIFPCVNATSTVNIIIKAQPDAGTGTTISVCDDNSTTIDLFSLLSGAQIGGIWTRSNGSGGNFDPVLGEFTPTPGAINSSFNYTITGALPCRNSTSTVNINIDPVVFAGNDDNITVCETRTTPISLIGIITNEQPGGVWSRIDGTGGVFNAALGEFTPTPGATTSTFRYKISGPGVCADDESFAKINITPQPNAGLDGTTPVCEGSTAPIDLNLIISGEQIGGTWIRTGGSGGVFNAIAGTFIPSTGATDSTFQYEIVAGLSCVNDISIATVDVNSAATITLDVAGTDAQSICINTPMVDITYHVTGATNATLTGALPLNVTAAYNPATGIFKISGNPASSGLFAYQITTSGGCPSIPANGTIEVKDNVTLRLISDAATAYPEKCIGETITPIRYQLAHATGAVATGLPAGLNQSYNPLTGEFVISGTVTAVGTSNFTVSTIADCGLVTLPGTIKVNPAATIALDSSVGTDAQRICINNQLTDISYVMANGATNASIVRGNVPRGISGAMVGGKFVISGTPTESGSFEYFVGTTGGCFSAEIRGTIFVNPLPTVSLPQNGFICMDATGNPKPGSTYTLTTGLNVAAYSFVWSDAVGVITGESGSSYTASAPGTYTVEITDRVTLCSNTTTATIVPSLPPIKAVASASNYFSDVQQVSVAVTPPGIYEYQLDNGAWQNSNQFVDLTTGTHVIKVRDKFACGLISTNEIYILDFPRFFTPNGDGYNDLWNIKGLQDQSASKIYIFDRYGKLLKEISPSGIGWDGTFNSQLMPASDYWFKVFFEESGMQKEFKSHFTLKR